MAKKAAARRRNPVQRVLTDNALAYRHSAAFRAVVADVGAVQRFCRPYHPETNGKVERFNRTLLARVGLCPSLCQQR